MFGKRLKELRLAASLTQAELGRALGVSASAIGMYEQGRREPDGKMLAKISEYFNVSLDYLLGSRREQAQNREVTELVDQMAQAMLDREGLMFNGKLMQAQDIQTVVDAMKLGAMLRLKQLEKTVGNGGDKLGTY